MDIIRRVVSDAERGLVAAGIAPVLARVFAARGIVSPADLDNDLAALPSWTSFKGIDDAARRLADAIQRGERVLIVADYDADGATACAVGVRGLRAMGADVDFLVPNRFKFGYGLTPEIVALAAQRAPNLIVTVDNGIASVDGVAAAYALGIDVLVTDHHLPGDRLPALALIVNPNQPGCNFPSKNVAGVGVMFYVLTAVRAALRERGHFAGSPARAEPNLAALLDLVALGTVADVVKLDHTNRIFVDQGLRRIRADRTHPGIRALFAIAGRDPKHATTYDLGFVVGPRLNAAGRLADMSIGIACLLADDVGTAQRLAGELDRLNRERRDVEATMQEEALAAVEGKLGDNPGGKLQGDLADQGHTLCLFDAAWHQGVVGIVASRLKDRYHRPTIVFARSDPDLGDAQKADAPGTSLDAAHAQLPRELRGSGRSIPGFHLRDALDLVAKRAPELITRFGGHAFAAGLSLPEDALPRFAEEFERIGREWLSPMMLRRELETDGELPLAELTFSLAQACSAQVWGQGFPAPAFDDDFQVSSQKTVGGNHTKLVLTLRGKSFDSIVFNDLGPFPSRIRAAYRPEVNSYLGVESLQLVILHWQPS